MKVLIAMILLWAVAFPSTGSATSLSNTNQSVYLAIAGCRRGSSGTVTTETIRFDDALLWMAFYDRGQIELSYPDPVYGVKAKMWNAEGKEVSATPLGKSYGTKWNELRSYKDSRVFPFIASGPFEKNQSLGGGKFLPSPAQLFRMEKSGTYTLEIQMQMFRHSASLDPAVWQTNLIRFQPIKIQVEKLAASQK